VPTIVTISVALVAVGLALFTWAMAVGTDPVAARITANLSRGLSVAENRQKAEPPLNRLAFSLTPPPIRRLVENLHAKAGRPGTWQPKQIYVLKLSILCVVGLLAAVLSGRGGLVAGAGFVFLALAYFAPELLLYSRSIERKEAITLELADTLDQMTITVEAGLAFDAAMAHTARNGRGVLAEELTRTLQDIQMGQTRRQAFESLARRTNVVELRRFVRSINQADEHGIALGDVLRTQAAEMRVKRRQRAEERAMKVPVKVVLPLILCILPVMFIIILGPAVMNIVDAFNGGLTSS
jgi:tight adherence protein C